MSDRHRERAENVVRTFKGTLSQAALSDISDAQFEDLALMVREAIAEELDAAANIVEEAARRLRREVEKRDLGL